MLSAKSCDSCNIGHENSTAFCLEFSDGEEELLESILSEQTPGFKLALSLLAAGVISSGALALCWLTGADPWGELTHCALLHDICYSFAAAESFKFSR